MKYVAAILICCLVFYLSYSVLAQENATTSKDRKSQRTKQEKTMTKSENDSQEPDEGDYFPDDQDVFSRKLFQKKLSPLTKKQKIVWTFRLSKTNTFL